MLKLLIVDDERIIRETMATLIDWESLGIQLIGTAKDGIEAYNIILDEYPEIILTDIKMPGLSGLDLIQKISEIHQKAHFIILSGYNEFEYAKEAMKYGVKHYILKPCNENQIIDSINSVKKDYADAMIFSPVMHQSDAHLDVYHSIMVNSLNLCLSAPPHALPLDSIRTTFSKYFDFIHISYELWYLYYVTPQDYPQILEALQKYKFHAFPHLLMDALYVQNTLILYYPSFAIAPDSVAELLHRFTDDFDVLPEFKHKTSDNLLDVLKELIPHIRRYDTIYYTSSLNAKTATSLNNYQNIIQETQTLVLQVFSSDPSVGQNALTSLLQLLSSISSTDFLKQLSTSIMMAVVTKSRTLDISGMREALLRLDTETSLPEIKKQIKVYLENHYLSFQSNPVPLSLSSKIKKLVQQHYRNSNLSLKWISENYLFMNVDYLSKKFLQETDCKFSKYLTDYRILKAKEFMLSSNIESIQEIADLVGCGNNPQYFSQIFKKATGHTPSKYIKTLRQPLSEM